MITPEELVQLIGTTTQDLSARIGVINKIWTTSNARVSGQFMYIRFQDRSPSTEKLIQATYGRILNFVIPKSRIDEVCRQVAENPKMMDPIVQLTNEARNLFIKAQIETSRSGEFGELLLYMIGEWILQAPIVACKMYLKTASQMPVHGSDGIHMGFEGDNLIIYWGESKMHKSLSGALKSAVESISTHFNSTGVRQNEVRILGLNLDLIHLEQNAKNALKDYFNPYKEKSNNLIECYICLIGFDSGLYKKAQKVEGSKCEDEFRSLYEKQAERIFKAMQGYIAGQSLQEIRLKCFLLPFNSIEDARSKFQEQLWGPI